MIKGYAITATHTAIWDWKPSPFFAWVADSDSNHPELVCGWIKGDLGIYRSSFYENENNPNDNIVSHLVDLRNGIEIGTFPDPELAAIAGDIAAKFMMPAARSIGNEAWLDEIDRIATAWQAAGFFEIPNIKDVRKPRWLHIADVGSLLSEKW